MSKQLSLCIYTNLPGTFGEEEKKRKEKVLPIFHKLRGTNKVNKNLISNGFDSWFSHTLERHSIFKNKFLP